MDKSWLKYFWMSVENNALRSKDVNTKVGAVIFSEEDKVEVSSGWNCLARGVKHLPERSTRPLKYKYTPHAEMNALVNAARMGRVTKGMSMMVSMFPCSICMSLIINSGITKVYTPEPDYSHAQYGEDFRISETMAEEADIKIEYLEKEEKSNEENCKH